MSAIFISHSSRDNAIAGEVRGWLHEHGYRSLFLDFDPADGIPAGRNWEQELYRRLRACQAVVVLCSAASMDSDWCFAEITHARALGKLIFPLRIGECRLRELLAEVQVVDATTNRDEGLARLLHGLRAAGLDRLLPWNAARPPYPGLMAFQDEDAAVYFGREGEIRVALDALTRLRRFDGSRLQVFVGASGSGKSSLLRAGVLPRLHQAHDAWVVLPPLRPSQHPLDELAMVLANALGGAAAEHWETIAAQLDRAAASPDQAAALWTRCLRELRQRAGGGERVVVFSIDQFEEALVATPRAVRFMCLIDALVTNPDRQAIVLATLRSDFLEALQKHPGLRTPFDTLPLGPLGVYALTQVIEGPAQVAGLEIERGLTERLVADTETDDGLPLLAFTLRELWERDGARGRLSHATYDDALGGMHGAVARAAEAVVDIDRLEDGQRHDLRIAFLALVRINDAGRYTRQAVRWDALPAGAHALLERFVDARLLVAGGEGQGRTVEVAHEALFRVWQRLRGWLDADREILNLRDGVRRAAAEWSEKGRPSELLVHRGGRLEATETLLREGRFALEAMQRNYLQACVDAREAQIAAERARTNARRRRVHITLAGLAAGLFVAIALGVWAMRERSQATERLADLHWVSGIGDRDVGHDPLKALHHFVQTATLSKNAHDTRSAVFASRLLRGIATLQAIVEPPDGIGHAAFADDATRLVVWSPTGAAAQWNPGEAPPSVLREADANRLIPSPNARWQVLVAEHGQRRIVDARTARTWLELSPTSAEPIFDGSESNIAVRDGRIVRVWRVPGAAPLRTLEHPARIAGVAFSTNGRHLLTWDDDRTARLWAVDEGRRLAEWREPDDIVGGIVADAGESVLLWSRQAPLSLRHPVQRSVVKLQVDGGSVPGVMGARFVSGGRELLTWNYGGVGVARLWDTNSGTQRLQMSHKAAIRDVAGDRSGRRLLSASDDGTATVWDARDGATIAVLAHRAAVRGANFSADGARVLTWSDDATARIWDAATGDPLSLPLHHARAVRGATWAPGDRSVLSWDVRTARVWRLDTDNGMRVIALQTAASVVQATFGSAAGEVLTLALDGRLQRWLDARPVGPAVELPRDTSGAAFDTEGTRLLTWGPQDAVVIHAVDSGLALLPPMRHEPSAFGIRGATFDASGTNVLSWGDDRTARLWDADSGRPLALLPHPAPVGGAAFGRGAMRAITWAEDRVVRLWQIPAGTLLHEWPPGPFGIRGATLAPDDVRLYTWDGNGNVRAFEVASGLQTGEWSHGAGTAVVGAQLSRDARRLVSWDERGGVRIWDIADSAHTEPVAAWRVDGLQAAAFSHDGRMVLSWGAEGARLWDSRSGQALSERFQAAGPVVGATLRSDDRALLAWSEDAVRVWYFGTGDDRLEADAVTGVQLHSGTRLDRNGQIELLVSGAWRALHDRLAPPSGTLGAEVSARR